VTAFEVLACYGVLLAGVLALLDPELFRWR